MFSLLQSDKMDAEMMIIAFDDNSITRDLVATNELLFAEKFRDKIIRNHRRIEVNREQDYMERAKRLRKKRVRVISITG